MYRLSTRVLQRELLDQGQLPDHEVRRSLLDLRQVNQLLQVRRMLLDTLAEEVARYDLTQFTVLDVASGSCDLPIAVIDWAEERQLEAQVFALEYQHRHLRLFRPELAAYANLHPFCADALHAPVLDHTFDFVTCCHFLHHLTDQQASALLSSMSQWARYAVIVTDIERHSLAYSFFQIFRHFLVDSYVSRTDGLISIQQSFRKEELERAAERAKLAHFSVERRWPFQLLLVAEHERTAPAASPEAVTASPSPLVTTRSTTVR